MSVATITEPIWNLEGAEWAQKRFYFFVCEKRRLALHLLYGFAHKNLGLQKRFIHHPRIDNDSGLWLQGSHLLPLT